MMKASLNGGAKFWYKTKFFYGGVRGRVMAKWLLFEQAFLLSWKFGNKITCVY